jgi:integrase
LEAPRTDQHPPSNYRVRHTLKRIDHAFKLDETIPKWKGWHCFRRSLASNLYALGVKPKVIQAILRHSNIATTLSFYVETPEAESREAMDKLMHLVK